MKNIKNIYQNNKIEINQKENTEKNKNDNLNLDKNFFTKNNKKSEDNSLNKDLEQHKDLNLEIKNKLINPDSDIENQENINDTLLHYIKSNLD